MRIANLSGRLVVVTGEPGHEIAYDVEKNSSGRFGADPQAIYETWDAFTAWAADARWEDGVPVRADDLGPPMPAPRQVLGIGLNYRDHAAESGFAAPAGEPPVFTKFPSCITGPRGVVTLPEGGHTDWEVELVVVIGRRAEPAAAAGDVIFTGTPSGVGLGRVPPRWLAPGDELVSHVAGIGELRHRFAAVGGRQLASGRE